MKGNLILIRGPICSGKTAVALALRDRLANASAVDYDAFKRMIDHRQSSDWRRAMALKTALFLAGLLLESGRIVIVDVHASYQDQYDSFQELAQKMDVHFHSLLLLPPLEVCLKRNHDRPMSDPVYNVEYLITDEKVRQHWQSAIRIKDEPVFDSSVLSPGAIADSILAAEAFALNIG